MRVAADEVGSAWQSAGGVGQIRLSVCEEDLLFPQRSLQGTHPWRETTCRSLLSPLQRIGKLQMMQFVIACDVPQRH